MFYVTALLVTALLYTFALYFISKSSNFLRYTIESIFNLNFKYINSKISFKKSNLIVEIIMMLLKFTLHLPDDPRKVKNHKIYITSN